MYIYILSISASTLCGICGEPFWFLIESYLQLFAAICIYLQLFAAICDYLRLFAAISESHLQLFATRTCLFCDNERALPWQCHGSAMELPWQCHGDAVALPWQCHSIAMAMPWKRLGSALAVPWHCQGIAIALPLQCHSHSHAIVRTHHAVGAALHGL